VLIAGPAVNIILAFLLVVGTLMVSGYTVVVDTNVVSAVEAESYAADAGLHAGDALVEINGQPCESWQDVSASLQDALRASQPFEIRYEREGQLHRAMIDIPEDEVSRHLGCMQQRSSIIPRLVRLPSQLSTTAGLLRHRLPS
jgi:regulator of sigma E protease